MNPLYEQAFLTQLEVYSTLLGERRIVQLCQEYTLRCLRDQPIPSPPPSPITIETDSLYDDGLNEATPPPVQLPPTPPPPTPPPEPEPKPDLTPVSLYKVVRLKKSAPLITSSPEAKQNLVNTIKKSTVVPKKKSTMRDLDKLVKLGLLPSGSKVIPSAPEVSPDIYGTIVVGSTGKAGIQPSWIKDTLYIGKSNPPTQFLAAVNKQFPDYRRYSRENAWNDVLMVTSSGSYVSLADLWNQSR